MALRNFVLPITILLFVGLLILPASAYDYSETFTETYFKDGWAKYTYSSSGSGDTVYFSGLYTNKIQDFVGIKSIVTIIESSYGSFPKSGTGKSTSFIGYIGDTQICSGTIGYNVNLNPDGSWKNTIYYILFDDFDSKQYSGSQYITLDWDTATVPKPTYVSLYYKNIASPDSKSDGYLDSYIAFSPSDTNRIPTGISTQYYVSHDWSNTVGINDYTNYLDVYIEKQLSASHVTIVDSISNAVLYSKTSTTDEYVRVYTPNINISITSLLNTYYMEYSAKTGGGPTPTPSLPTRTGTVTMTDHNGTTISGFEVKAVNYYTGEEYTVSTDTDVATITLPMDHTTSMRNPQTGEYEDVPVGYYTFFVYKPGYKMTSEDGVRISVLPLEYSPYHFGDIIVTSEDGYLTGKHQFQIRSRADLSILQTGTISAKSATTGEWYNTTVDNGIATLILPYDTSTAIFPYVGNYYVYATSPGYIPSEYATQISVRPDTQSEIRYVLLTPIGGIPEPGNVTLRIQAYSDSWQEIPNAEIHIDGVGGAGWEIWETYTASAAGYAEISVPGNSTYDITVYGQGYYSSSQRIEVGDTDPPLITFILYPTGAPTLTPTTQPTGWVTPPPTTQPSPGIPDEDDDSEGFMMEAIRGISKAFGVGFATGKTIFGMLLALAIGFATAKQLRGGAAEFGLGLLGGTMLGVLIGLLPIWTVVVLLLIVGMYIGYRYVGGSSNG